MRNCFGGMNAGLSFSCKLDTWISKKCEASCDPGEAVRLMTCVARRRNSLTTVSGNNAWLKVGHCGWHHRSARLREMGCRPNVYLSFV